MRLGQADRVRGAGSGDLEVEAGSRSEPRVRQAWFFCDQPLIFSVICSSENFTEKFKLVII